MRALIKITFQAIDKLCGKSALNPTAAERARNPGTVLAVIGIGRARFHFTFTAFAALFPSTFFKFPAIHISLQNPPLQAE